MTKRVSIKNLLIQTGYSIVTESETFIEGIKPLGYSNLYFKIKINF